MREKAIVIENIQASKWTRVGDRCSKELFEQHAPPRKAVQITKLHDNGKFIQGQKEIEKLAQSFYKRLYTQDHSLYYMHPFINS